MHIERRDFSNKLLWFCRVFTMIFLQSCRSHHHKHELVVTGFGSCKLCCKVSGMINSGEFKAKWKCLMWYDTRHYFNVHSKADITQLNLPHGTALNERVLDLLQPGDLRLGQDVLKRVYFVGCVKYRQPCDRSDSDGSETWFIVKMVPIADV